VISLFTNVPLDFALESLNKRWPYIERFTKIPMCEFILAIKFILSSTYFTFNNTIYKQTWHPHEITIVANYRGDCDVGFEGERSQGSGFTHVILLSVC